MEERFYSKFLHPISQTNLNAKVMQNSQMKYGEPYQRSRNVNKNCEMPCNTVSKWPEVTGVLAKGEKPWLPGVRRTQPVSYRTQGPGLTGRSQRLPKLPAPSPASCVSTSDFTARTKDVILQTDQLNFSVPSSVQEQKDLVGYVRAWLVFTIFHNSTHSKTD